MFEKESSRGALGRPSLYRNVLFPSISPRFQPQAPSKRTQKTCLARSTAVCASIRVPRAHGRPYQILRRGAHVGFNDVMLHLQTHVGVTKQLECFRQTLQLCLHLLIRVVMFGGVNCFARRCNTLLLARYCMPDDLHCLSAFYHASGYICAQLLVMHHLSSARDIHGPYSDKHAPCL